MISRGTLTPNACTSGAFSVAARNVAPSEVFSMIAQVLEADDEGCEHHPAAIVRHEHEAEIGGALQHVGNAIGQAGTAIGVAEQTLDHQRQAEGQQQAVQ